MSEATLTPTQADVAERSPARSSGAFAHIWTIAKREIGGYFESPIAYVFIVIFLLLAGFFTFMTLLRLRSQPQSPSLRLTPR